MIKLVPLNEESLEWARELHNDPDVLKMLTNPNPVSFEQQLVWFELLERSKVSQRLLVLFDGVRIGIIRLDHIDYNNMSICVGLDIHKDYRGKGYAKLIYKEIFKKLFGEEKFNRLWLLVISYNEVARHLYKALGFVEEGVQREAIYRDFKYYDYFMMSKLKNEWTDKND